MKQSVVLFIDIDNCIMDSAFNNIKFYSNDYEKIENIIDAYKQFKNIQLYPEFVRFFEKISNNKEYEIRDIYFVTGRQEDIFGWITRKQLQYLEKFNTYFLVTYYYRHGKHNWEVYKNFKISTVLNYLEFEQFHGIIKIYDDFDFHKEFEEALDIPFEFHLITCKEDWNYL